MTRVRRVARALGECSASAQRACSGYSAGTAQAHSGSTQRALSTQRARERHRAGRRFQQAHTLAITQAGPDDVAFARRSCGANIGSQYAAVLAVRDALNEHFGTAPVRRCGRCAAWCVGSADWRTRMRHGWPRMGHSSRAYVAHAGLMRGHVRGHVRRAHAWHGVAHVWHVRGSYVTRACLAHAWVHTWAHAGARCIANRHATGTTRPEETHALMLAA